MFEYFRELLNVLTEIRDLLKAADSRLENIEMHALNEEDRKRANSGYT